MHIEKNFSENILHTIMDVPGKTKDNVNARLDLEALSAREELHIRTRENGNPFKPKAKHTLSVEQKRALCEWFRMLSMLDGYSSNFANKIDPSSTRLQNMKSHNHHVFLGVLLPIAFSSLPAEVLEPLSSLSDFFKNLCANELREDILMEMHRTISIILCKLEIIFPPAFWNAMEYIPVHLAQEAVLGGPVHYRWMYPFERFFNWLKKKAKNKSQLESSMVMYYLIYEIQIFGSHYFEPALPSKIPTRPRNDILNHPLSSSMLTVFHMKGSPFGRARKQHPTPEEYKAAHLHVLLNCSEVQPSLQ